MAEMEKRLKIFHALLFDAQESSSREIRHGSDRHVFVLSKIQKSFYFDVLVVVGDGDSIQGVQSNFTISSMVLSSERLPISQRVMEGKNFSSILIVLISVKTTNPSLSSPSNS